MTAFLPLGVGLLALLGLSLWLILKPRKSLPDEQTADPIAHFKEQLADLARDTAEGTLDTETARTARLEIERRILKADSHKTENPVPATQQSLGLKAAALFMLIGSAGLYALLGSPMVPAAPTRLSNVLDTPIEEGGLTVGESITEIEKRLEKEPDNLKGLELLGRLYGAVGDYSRAVALYERLTKLQPDVIRWRIDRLETFLAMGHGTLSPAAKLVLDDVLQTSPDHPAAQYYLGLWHLQTGEPETAKAIWTALADRSGADAPWMPALTNQLSELGVRPPKLNNEQMAAVNDMSEEERAAFIQSMMERLRARLDSAPNDPEGWLMLARSEAATGDTPAAIATLEHALTVVTPENSADIQAFLDNLRGVRNP